MGVVYHPEKVAAGEIPADKHGQSQYDAAVLLGEALYEQAAMQPESGTSLVAYMLYGSVSRGYSGMQPATRRSDVDVLFVLDEASKSSTIRELVADRAAAIGQALHTQIGATIYTKEALEGGMRVNPFYAQHLELVHGNPPNPVLQYFSPVFWHAGLADPLFGKVPFVEAWPFAIKYLEARRSVLQSQLDEADPDVTLLKGPFELPRNLGRMLADLFYQYICEHTDSYNLKLDDIVSPLDQNLPYWLQLLQITELTGTSSLIAADIERLNELDGTYTDLLEATIRGDIPLEQYEAWLKSVYIEALERAFKIVSMADTIVYRTVELAQIDPTYDQALFDDDSLTGWYVDDRDEEYKKELRQKIHRARQITPVEYDVSQLLFRVAAKYPDMAARYKTPHGRRPGITRDDDFALQLAWLDSRRKMRAEVIPHG